MDSDMACLNKKLIKKKKYLLPNITEVMGNLVTFGCCALKGTGVEFVGVILEGRFQGAEIIKLRPSSRVAQTSELPLAHTWALPWPEHYDYFTSFLSTSPSTVDK